MGGRFVFHRKIQKLCREENYGPPRGTNLWRLDKGCSGSGEFPSEPSFLFASQFGPHQSKDNCTCKTPFYGGLVGSHEKLASSPEDKTLTSRKIKPPGYHYTPLVAQSNAREKQRVGGRKNKGNQSTIHSCPAYCVTHKL